MFSEFGLIKHFNCIWHKLLSALTEAAKMCRVSLAEEKKKKQMVPSNGSRIWALN